MSKPYHGRPDDLPRIIYQGEVYHPHIVRRILEPGMPLAFGNEYGGYFKITLLTHDESRDVVELELEHFMPPKMKVVMRELREILVKYAPAVVLPPAFIEYDESEEVDE